MLLAGLGILLGGALRVPPALPQMTQLEVPLAGQVRVVRREKGGAYIAVPLSVMRGEVRYLCSQADCALPARFSVLRPGAIVRVWLDGSVIWQLQYGNELLIDYADVRADYRHDSRMAMALALLLLGGGAVLCYWGLHPAPAQVAMLDR